jgi:nucleotide-binding universal stress UspA family protein
MYRNILVPLDLTDRHQPALRVAAELVAQSGGTVTLLHVIEVIAGMPIEEERTFYGRLERMARVHLERSAAQLGEKQVRWQAETIYGNRTAEILRRAAGSGADLIVLTAPTISPEHPTGWGSLSFKISALSPCPVLLVK